MFHLLQSDKGNLGMSIEEALKDMVPTHVTFDHITAMVEGIKKEMQIFDGIKESVSTMYDHAQFVERQAVRDIPREVLTNLPLLTSQSRGIKMGLIRDAYSQQREFARKVTFALGSLKSIVYKCIAQEGASLMDIEYMRVFWKLYKDVDKQYDEMCKKFMLSVAEYTTDCVGPDPIFQHVFGTTMHEVLESIKQEKA